MSVRQAARKGGPCRRNISAAVTHLDGRQPQLVPSGPRDGLRCPGLVEDLLGPLAPARKLPDEVVATTGPNLGRAILIVD
eukprot:9461586-Alexandrium_andersonii.AAC.1